MSFSSLSLSGRRFALAALSCLALGAQANGAQSMATYEVTVTNITYNQRLTPVLLATHKPDIAFFTLGQAASPELATLAEEGNVAPLRAVLQASASVTATEAGSALLDPGKSVTFRIQGRPLRDRLSMAAMLIPTNDAFMALNAAPLPLPGQALQSHTVVAYDAGSEVNDELCASIPGPSFVECGGPGGGADVGGGEGFVHVHRGVQGVGQLKASDRDWRNPVAVITIRAVN
jgi:hypothetical protein